MTPRVSVSQITTFTASFADDIRIYTEAGLDGIGVWELKLADDSLELFEASGLDSAAAVPNVPSILPLPLLGGPDDPAERIDAFCASLERLAPFRPSGVVCLTGTAQGRDPDTARAIVVDGLRTAAREAERLGLRIAVEPYQREGGELWTIVSSIAEAVDLIHDAGDPPSLAIQFDVWHLWNCTDLVADIHREVERFAGVHVCDVREPTRGWADRVLPGDGIAPVAEILHALDDAGWSGLYDIEIFSDDGSLGTVYPDSLWARQPQALASQAVAAFEREWEGPSVISDRGGLT